MRRTRLIALGGAAFATIAVAMFISAHVVGGQSEAASSPITQVYNPYPPGILPSDLSSETARVQREVDLIEERALARWHTLKTPILTGQPPILQNTGTEAIETLGELMLFDKNISPNKNEACASCHMPYAGFSGPIPSVNLTMVAFPGSVHFRAGKRTPQRHPYAPFFPVLQYNQVQGLFFGGNFWDSRATGYRLRIPDAEQAQGPPVDHSGDGFPRYCLHRVPAFRRPCTDLSLKRSGAKAHSISSSHARPSKSAQPLEELLCLAGSTTPVPLSPATAPAQTWFMTAGPSRSTHSSSPCR